MLAYDGKTDRLADIGEGGATLDFEAVHARGDASLKLPKAEVQHSGMYICTVYLPYLVAQVTMELEVVGKGIDAPFLCVCFSKVKVLSTI